ncbi:MAG: type II toxin-antitoxin system PemK/MazF family toxin [Bacteroidia bacterium]|nr:type II toxin-antitoxin system PemK/MazF family toxin [Bacteroidia bacterium]
MKKGDIVLVSFPFTDFSGDKIRPALVLSVSSLDVIIAFISTQLHRKGKNDIALTPALSNRLKKDSIVRLSKLATVDKKIVLGLLGVLSEEKLKEVDDNLMKLFQL